jgi:hypothetical protein
MTSLVIIGAILARLGIVTMAFPAFGTRDTKEVAKLCDVATKVMRTSCMSSLQLRASERSCSVAA